MAVLTRISKRLKRSWLAPLVGGLASSIPSVWERMPHIGAGDSVCIFVTYAREGRISAHALYHAQAWVKAGFKVILTIVLDDLEAEVIPKDLDFAAGVFLRSNEGYDFGAWAATINSIGELGQIRLLCIANDSVFGPFDTFPHMLERVASAEADVIGLTESFETTRHFQSYMIFFRQVALNNKRFVKFWRRVRTGDRWFVIREYELALRAELERAGLRTLALFPAEDNQNPTLTRWRELIAAGFPFVKVQLLRENPFAADVSGWEALVGQYGYDPTLILRYLRGAAQSASHSANL